MAHVSSVYDGDTFTCIVNVNQVPVSVKVRCLGYDSEEIKCKQYSALREYTPRNELERAIMGLVDAKSRARALGQVVDHRGQIADVHELLFRRLSALTAKYALVEWFKRCSYQVHLDIPNLPNSFDRVLAHVYATDKQKESLCDYMIAA